MIIGRLTRDPEARTMPSGVGVSNFSLATNFIWTNSEGQRQERVEYHNIVAWRKLADICNQYLKKGSKAYIEGRLQTRSWTDQNGVTKYRTEIVADNLIMLDRAPAGGGQQFSGQNETAGQSPAPIDQPGGDEARQALGEEEIKIEDIPF